MKKILFFILLCPFNILAQSWVNVGHPGFSSKNAAFTCLATSKSGTPFVVFADGTNGYKATVMKYDGSDWVAVGSLGFSLDTAYYTTIALDTNGTPYVAFEDWAMHCKTTVMKFNGSDWETVGSAGFSADTAYYTSIALDANGVPYVVYQDFSNGLKATVMKYDGLNWAVIGTPGCSDSIAFYTSIAINRDGQPYIVYADFSSANGYTGLATVKKFNGTSWETVGSSSFSGEFARFTSISIDTAGTPYVVYSRGFGLSGNPGYVTVKKFNGADWVGVGSNSFSSEVTGFPAIAFDKWGYPVVVYTDGFNYDRATVKRFNGASWITVGISGFSTYVAEYTSISIWNNFIYVAYSDGNDSFKTTVMKFEAYVSVPDAESLLNTKINVFPNPCSGSFNIDISLYELGTKVSITNLFGGKIKEIECSAKGNAWVQLDAPAGLYFISATASGQKTICIPLLVQ